MSWERQAPGDWEGPLAFTMPGDGAVVCDFARVLAMVRRRDEKLGRNQGDWELHPEVVRAIWQEGTHTETHKHTLLCQTDG